MRSKLRLQHVIAIVFSFLVVLCFGSTFSQNVEAQASTPTPTPTRTPIRVFASRIPARVTAIRTSPPIVINRATPIATRFVPGGGTGGCACVPADLVALLGIMQQKIKVNFIELNPHEFSVPFANSFAPDSPVHVYIFRTLDSLNMLDERAAGIVMSDATGSLSVLGTIPEYSAGGPHFGVACTLDDCSAENILGHLDSADVQIWQFDLEPLIKIDEAVLDPIQEPAPAIGVDFSLAPGLSRWNTAFQWYKDGEPLPATNNPLYSLSNPFVVTENNRVELYQPRAFVLEKANAWFGTQFTPDALPAGIYTVDTYVNGVYEQTIEIPVGVVP